MGISTKGFSPFDIRGIYPEEVNEELAYRVGRIYPGLFHVKHVAVGRDVRLSSPSLREALVKGLTEAGCHVLDIGRCGTEMIYYATTHLELDGGIMVTASHNPKEYNGLKLVKKGARPISSNTGLKDLEKAVSEKTLPPIVPGGTVEERNILQEYVQHILSYVDLKQMKPFKVVVNAGNGAAGPVLEAMEKHLPFELVKVFTEPDGNFPNGVPNPLRQDSRAATIQAVQESHADVGVAWDGDFDRCFLFDETGGFIEGSYMVGFLAAAFLKKNPGARIVYDPRIIWNTVEIVEKLGGTPVICKSGHAFIKDKMREVDAVYGGELSAHHYFRDFSYCDSGMIPWLLVLELLSRSDGRKLSELMRSRQEKYPASGELSSRVKDPQAVFRRIEEIYAPRGEVSYLDGLSVAMENWRFNIRMSSTEPYIRLNVESRHDRKLLEEKTEELLRIIRE